MASATASVFKVVIQLLLLPIMARLLGPEEFGVYALALPTVAFVALIADGGLGATLAREEESHSIVWSSAFWVLLLTCAALALGTTLFGVILGMAIHQPRVPLMIACLSLSLMFLAISVGPTARLNRRKNLVGGAIAELVGNTLGAVAAVVLAIKGAGAWSLVAQYIITYAMRAAILNVAAFKMPRLEFSMSAIRPHMVAGGMLVGTRLGEYAGRFGENIFVDRAFGTALLGSFTFATQVSRFVCDSAGNLLWSVLYVQVLTSQKEGIPELYRKLSRLLGSILLPVTFLGCAAAPELADILLGPKWGDIVLLLRVFLPTAAIAAIASQIGAVLLAINRFDILFWCSMAQSASRVIVVCLAPWIGLTGMVFGLAIVNVLGSAALLIFSEKPTGCGVRPLLASLVKPAIASAAAAGACLIILQLHAVNIEWTVLSLVLGIVTFALVMLVIDKKGLLEDWESIRPLIRRRTA